MVDNNMDELYVSSYISQILTAQSVRTEFLQMFDQLVLIILLYENGHY